MKKIFAIVLGLSLASQVLAQDASGQETPVLRSKKGEAYLPVAGEWGLGVSANPFLDYIGNFLNGATANDAPAFGFVPNVTNNIAAFGKLMVDEHTAYRVRFNVSVLNDIDKRVVNQDELNPDPGYPSFTQDWRKEMTTAIVIAPGIEKRRGNTRLQGIYGGELMFGFNNQKVEYDYGNPMSADFNSATTHNFGGNIVTLVAPGRASERVIEDKDGTHFLVGARGFIGIEYFFAPRISIGGEFGYMVAFETQGKSVTTAERWDGANLSTREIKRDNNGGLTTMGVGLDNLNGSINLLFYF